MQTWKQCVQIFCENIENTSIAPYFEMCQSQLGLKNIKNISSHECFKYENEQLVFMKIQTRRCALINLPIEKQKSNKRYLEIINELEKFKTGSRI